MTKSIKPSLCGHCSRRRAERTDAGRITCDAYPFGVPQFVILGADHRQALEGDNGIQFEEDPADKVPAYILEFYDKQED